MCRWCWGFGFGFSPHRSAAEGGGGSRRQGGCLFESAQRASSQSPPRSHSHRGPPPQADKVPGAVSFGSFLSGKQRKERPLLTQKQATPNGTRIRLQASLSELRRTGGLPAGVGATPCGCPFCFRRAGTGAYPYGTAGQGVCSGWFSMPASILKSLNPP